jgi:hydrogenase expression/formation protein HypE
MKPAPLAGLHPSSWICPLPLRDYPHIVMGHGGGGRLSADLIEHLVLPSLQGHDPSLQGQDASALADSTVLPPITGRLAVSTDSYVVRPIFFPGGSIGQLAVNGTVNDLAMSGATPLYLSVALILEEGLPLDTLARVLVDMGAAARAASVRIVAGDTKVVGAGQADSIFINTTGIGEVPSGLHIHPGQARPGDVVIVSGSIGDHGMAIMSLREGIEFSTTLCSDCAALHGLVQSMLSSSPVPSDIHVLRDPTRGGLAASLNEIARSSQVGISLEESAIPIQDEVRSACEILGLDPLHVANEGKLVAVVAHESAPGVLEAMRNHPLGGSAAIIGSITSKHPGVLVARTPIGGTRIVPMPLGEQLPRIC